MVDLKLSSIVKPSNLADFLRLQVSCLSGEMPGLRFVARFDHSQPHCLDQPQIELLAIYEIALSPALEISFLVTDRAEQALAGFEQSFSGKEIAAQLQIAWIELQHGLNLQAVEIPKPWGKEIWHTGIEQRGVSRVISKEGSTALDWVIAAAPQQVLGNYRTPVLLKILDPVPDEVYGDLYFEIHEEKQEVYVVTHIDAQAWPEGRGGIRFGFNQALRKSFSSDGDFKRAYRDAVRRYRAVRQRIDKVLDEKREAENVGLNDPVRPDVMQGWMKNLDQAWLREEKALRDAMENFLAIRPLSVGEVITVPCLTPHSLQHGVRTVEFQTPVYERKILSFAQKVLTQPHWDTEEAIEKLSLDEPPQENLIRLYRDEKVCRENVVQFSDFRVERITLQRGARFSLQKQDYQLLLVVEGELALNGKPLRAAEAVLVPALGDFQVESQQETVLLLAEPLPV
jgi:mannose-6-phosphate isomerase-like protein (cupin superfamily)